MKSSENNSPDEEKAFVPQNLPDQGPKSTPLGMLLIGLLVIVLILGGASLFLAKTVTLTTNTPKSEISHIDGLSVLNGNTLYGYSGEHTLKVSADGYKPQEVTLNLSGDVGPTFDVELAELPGVISFRLSGPDSAQLYLNGELFDEIGSNPVEVERGTFQYRIEHPKYLAAEGELTVDGFGAEQTIPVTLNPNWRTVTLSTAPSEASVYQDEMLLGQTPLTIDLAPNLYVLSFKKEGYTDARQLLEIELGQPLAVEQIALEPLGGALDITTAPAGARVFIDDVYVGTSPLKYAAAADKNYAIRVEKSGFDRWSGSASVKTNGTAKVSATLKQQFGTLTITSKPTASVYINNERKGATPLELRLPVEDHGIELRLQGFRTIERKISIKKNEQDQIDATLLTEKEARYAEAKSKYRAASGINMVLAKPSTFKMGAPRGEPGQRANEIEKTVTMQRWFYIAETEVSHSHFSDFAREMAGSIPALRSISRSSPNHPVTQIDWQTAALYCNWLSTQEGLPQAYQLQGGKLILDTTSIGYRLPTEAEWEWSARVAGRPGRAQNKYPWGSGATVPSRSGNFADTTAPATLPNRIPNYSDGFSGVAPVGSFSPNPLGLYDLGGNVAEWVHDYYGIELTLPGRTLIDHTGPKNGLDHVVKGSSWRSGNETELRYSFRTYSDGPADHIGFRIARWVH